MPRKSHCGDGYILGNVRNGGLISPGESPGPLHIDGQFTQTASGKLEIGLASTSRLCQCLPLIRRDPTNTPGTL